MSWRAIWFVAPAQNSPPNPPKLPQAPNIGGFGGGFLRGQSFEERGPEAASAAPVGAEMEYSRNVLSIKQGFKDPPPEPPLVKNSNPLKPPPNPPKLAPELNIGGFGGDFRHGEDCNRADPDTWAERAATLQYDAGLTRTEAERQAAAEQGFETPAALFATACRQWRAAIAVLARENPPREAKPHLAAALRFLASHNAERALSCGWTTAELIGLDPRAPWFRYDKMGAAYYPHPVHEITESFISHITPTGAILVLRKPKDMSGCVLPWDLTNTTQTLRSAAHAAEPAL